MRRSQKLTIMVLILLLAAAINTFVVIIFVKNIEYDINLINFSGIIRASIQRSIKTELNNNPDNFLIESIDKIMQKYSEHPKASSIMKFEEVFHELELDWEKAKELIYDFRRSREPGVRDELFRISEILWSRANNIVLEAQIISEKKVIEFKAIYIFMILSLIGIFVIILYIRKYVANELEILAMKDSLTQIYNRSCLDDFLMKELERLRRYKRPFCVIMFDIDNFKNINDTYGHDKGDLLLKNISKIVKQNIRISDVLFRLGGDEFMVIFPESNSEQAFTAAEKIRSMVEKTVFFEAERTTISIGLAQAKEEDTVSSLYKRTDIALYFAKRLGKNRTEISG
ncbi:MAG: GGDEF domain-containing protein [Petrotogaceae bacterium]|nr:GGDEF domain-containing protein [Petrotogaceae bacterium]